MSSAQTHPLVDDYLRRLDAAAAGLPAERRAELVGEISEHLREALGAGGTPHETAVRNVLERLGAPEEIVVAEPDAPPDPVAAPAAQPAARTEPPAGRKLGGLEIAAILTLVVGATIAPVINVAVGLVLAWLSDLWTRAEKLVATAVPVALTLVAGLAFAARVAGWLPEPDTADTGAGLELLPDSAELLVGAALFGAPVLGGLIAAILLAVRPRRRRRRAASESPESAAR